MKNFLCMDLKGSILSILNDVSIKIYYQIRFVIYFCYFLGKIYLRMKKLFLLKDGVDIGLFSVYYKSL